MISDVVTKKIKRKKLPAMNNFIIWFIFLCISLCYAQIALKVPIEINDQLTTLKSFYLDNLALYVIPFLLIDNFASARIYLKIVVSAFLLLNIFTLLALQMGIEIFSVQENIETYRRFSGMLDNANQMSYFLCFLMPFFYFFLKIEKNKILIIFYYCGIIATFISIAMSGSRGGLLSFIVVMSMIAVAAKDFKIPVVILCTCIVFFVTAVSYNSELIQQTFERFSLLWTANLDKASAGRTVIWKGLYDVIVSNPLYIIMGTGVGTCRVVLAQFTGITAGSHNIYLQFLVEFGLIGFAIWISALYNIYKFARNIILKREIDYLFRKLMFISFFSILLGWMFSDLRSILRFVIIVSATALSYLYHSQLMNDEKAFS